MLKIDWTQINMFHTQQNYHIGCDKHSGNYNLTRFYQSISIYSQG